MNKRIYDDWTLSDFAIHYADTIASPANGCGQHISPIFGQSHFVMIRAAERFSSEEVESAFSEAIKARGI